MAPGGFQRFQYTLLYFVYELLEGERERERQKIASIGQARALCDYYYMIMMVHMNRDVAATELMPSLRLSVRGRSARSL